MRELTVRVHDVEEDGLPKREVLDGRRMAFVFEGAMVSGWPSRVDPRDEAGERILWQAHPTVFFGEAAPHEFSGVTHWIEFPLPVEDLVEAEPATPRPAADPD